MLYRVQIMREKNIFRLPFSRLYNNMVRARHIISSSVIIHFRHVPAWIKNSTVGPRSSQVFYTYSYVRPTDLKLNIVHYLWLWVYRVMVHRQCSHTWFLFFMTNSFTLRLNFYVGILKNHNIFQHSIFFILFKKCHAVEVSNCLYLNEDHSFFYCKM